MSVKHTVLKLFSLLAILAMLLSNTQPPIAQAQSGGRQASEFAVKDPEIDKQADILPTVTPESSPPAEPTITPTVPEPISAAAQTHEELPQPPEDVQKIQTAELTSNTWYVATTGDDSNSCATFDAPCATIGGALTKTDFVANDTVKVASGIYTGNGTYSVTLDKSVILSGGWDPTFDAQTGFSTVDGNNSACGIFIYDFNLDTVLTVTIEYFVVENSQMGIYNREELTVSNSIIQNNSGTGIYNDGNQTISNSIVRNNSTKIEGGGIYNASTGKLVITNGSIRNNSAEYDGGGIYNAGSLTINTSSIQNNYALNGSGGGIHSVLSRSIVTVSNTTIGHNAAMYSGGGLQNESGGNISLNNTTVGSNFAASGAGIYNDASSVSVQNSIFGDNGPGSDCVGTIASGGNNIISSTTDCSVTATASDKLNVDPKLGTFLPVQGYQPILSTSPAINTGNQAACPATDQRGVARVGACDIGAYEYTTPGAAATVAVVSGSGQHSSPGLAFRAPLAAVVVDEKGSPVSNVSVTFHAPVNGASGTFANTASITTTAVTNAGGIATAAVFTANNQIGRYAVSASIDVPASTTFDLENLIWYVSPTGNDSNTCSTPALTCATIDGALGKANAGETIYVAEGTYVGAPLTIAAVHIYKSIILLGGWNSTYTAQTGRSTIDGEYSRAGIEILDSPSVVVSRFLITRGYNCCWSGGGIRSGDSTLTLDNILIADNVSNYSGGGIGLFHSTATINNSSIFGNLAVTTNGGGGIYTSNSTTTINNSLIYGNEASSGGGIESWGPSITTINNSAIFLNTATSRWGGGSGGGLMIYGNGVWDTSLFLAINNSTIGFNTAEDAGGAIASYVTGNNSIRLNYVTVAENHARTGGSLGGSSVSIKNSIVAHNTSEEDYYCEPPLRDGNSIFFNNDHCDTYYSGPPAGSDPKLGSFFPAGGYFPLLPGSPAINVALANDCPVNDQRGVSRPQDSYCDIGAYESRNVQVTIAGNWMDDYEVLPSASLRLRYAGVDSGPVQVTSNWRPIVASLRDLWSDGTNPSSSVQLMGLPAGQLSSTYVFPAYNNVSLDDQLRFGNVGTAPTVVTVTIGGVVRGRYNLAPSQSMRVNYAGVDSGPVVVQSSGSVPIIASIRDSWWDGSSWSSYSQLMGLPGKLLSSTYVFPAYNNVSLDDQLRIGNVGTAKTKVTVTIGGVYRGSYDLNPSQSMRVYYPGVDGGPVVVQSSGNVPIIASIRDSWKDGNDKWSSYFQLMGLPGSLLSNTYVFPIYDNVNVDAQLRVGNVGSAPTTVTVTIAGVVKGTYSLGANQSFRAYYAGVNAGPLVVQSSGGVPIIASIRDSLWDGSTWSSYSQLMGLPASQLSTTYVFPAYNNVSYDNELRIAVP